MNPQFVTVHGCRYRVVTREQGAPLLLLHGFTGSADAWQPLMEALPNTLMPIAIDLPGHGQTDAPPNPARYGMGETIRDLTMVMDALGHGKFHCLGYSMGGRIALSLAARVPERVEKLILESASPGLASAEDRARRIAQDTRLAERIEHEGVPAFVEHWQSIPLFASQKRIAEAARQAQRSIRLAQRAEGLANSLRGIGTGAQPSVWGELERLTMPTLLITGDEDEKFTAIAEMMRAQMKHAVHRQIGKAGHTVHLEQPGRYAEIVQDFLSSPRQADGQFEAEEVGR